MLSDLDALVLAVEADPDGGARLALKDELIDRGLWTRADVHRVMLDRYCRGTRLLVADWFEDEAARLDRVADPDTARADEAWRRSYAGRAADIRNEVALHDYGRATPSHDMAKFRAMMPWTHHAADCQMSLGFLDSFAFWGHPGEWFDILKKLVAEHPIRQVRLSQRPTLRMKRKSTRKIPAASPLTAMEATYEVDRRRPLAAASAETPDVPDDVLRPFLEREFPTVQGWFIVAPAGRGRRPQQGGPGVRAGGVQAAAVRLRPGRRGAPQLPP